MDLLLGLLVCIVLSFRVPDIRCNPTFGGGNALESQVEKTQLKEIPSSNTNETTDPISDNEIFPEWNSTDTEPTPFYNETTTEMNTTATRPHEGWGISTFFEDCQRFVISLKYLFLEIIGSIIGLSWGAYSTVNNALNGNGEKPTFP